MQFKNPEILYLFSALIIPILVHLFQLQKFIKVPFTNVAFLQKIAQQTRKSSRIKKWLILTLRLFLFSAIVLAFSQPYFSNKTADKKQHISIYLDNSLSTNAKGKKGVLVKSAIKEIIENSTKENLYSLQTNDGFYKNLTKKSLKKTLLNITETSKKQDISTVLLKLNQTFKNKTNTLNKTILISDFQNKTTSEFTNVTPAFSAIQLKPSLKNNISVDSVFISNSNSANFTINAIIKNQGDLKKNIPVAIYNNNKLVSKQTTSLSKDSEKTIQFIITNKDVFNGKIQLTYSDIFNFDNTFYFNYKTNQKINVLAIGNPSEFLSKIYTKNEFNFTHSKVLNTNYNNVLKQQLIVLNELENIPDILSKKIIEFLKNGGNLAIIPNENSDINSYNKFLKKLEIGTISSQQKDSLKITNINYNHPLFKNVFSKKINNFQYPITTNHYPIKSQKTSTILSLENSASFISEIQKNNSKIYWISSPLNKNNSNFTNSPLVVPVFYNFGKQSFKHPKLFYRLHTENTIDVVTKSAKDEVLKITNATSSFIPLQQIYQNKVKITTNQQPLKAGFYNITKAKDTLGTIAYNYPKSESLLQFLDLKKLAAQQDNCTVYDTVAEALKNINKKNEVHWLWKWFLALAIVSLCLEILILKFYKP